MKKSFFLFFLVPALLLSETSVFDNKGIESKKVYGFSETEQYIYDNKKDLKNLRSRLFSLEEKVSTYQTTQNGFKDLVRSHSQKISKFTKQIDSIEKRVEKMELLMKNLEVQIADIGLDSEVIKNDNKQQKIFNKTAKDNDKKFETKTLEIVTIVNKLKKTAVTQKELKKIIKKLITQLEKNKKENEELNKVIKYSNPDLFFKNKKPADILSSGTKYLKSGNFDEARVRLFYLLNNSDYEKAKVLFYIGELEYKQNNYTDAINSFKASGGIDTKASYMDVLLYHTGISYEKNKDKKNAIKFYKTLIEKYPKSNLIKGAKSRVKRLSKKK